MTLSNESKIESREPKPVYLTPTPTPKPLSRQPPSFSFKCFPISNFLVALSYKFGVSSIERCAAVPLKTLSL